MPPPRLATAADLRAIGALFAERDRTEYDVAAVSRRLGGLDPALARTVVIEDADGVAAMSTILLRDFGTARRTHRVGYWTDLYVAERARGSALYLPLVRATLAASADAGATATMTANRRRDVFRSHQKLGFRIAAAIPTRARPVRALGAALDLVSGRHLGGAATALDALALGALDRRTRRSTDAGLRVATRPVDPATIALLLPCMQRDRGRAAGSRLDPAGLARRYATALDGRDYDALVATRGDAVVGAAIVRAARRGRFELTVVLDLFDGGESEVFHRLVRAVEEHARDARTDLVLVLDGVADQSARWDEAGYPATPEWYVVLVAPSERATDPVLGDGSSFRFPFSEHDAF